MTIKAWLMDDDETVDQRLPRQRVPNVEVSSETLVKLGVLHWSGFSGPDDERLDCIRKERGYSYSDTVFVTPEKLPDYENKIKAFFREHIHYDEEIRFCINGSGYFDVRGFNDDWIRIAVEPGDLIILPEGIYHRFTNDEKNFMHALRLFVGEPIWTPYNRDEIDEKKNASRLKYVERFLSN
jgi:1,2-dihydroxy-3-keto-5-methylthiopentene dioxygenase